VPSGFRSIPRWLRARPAAALVIMAVVMATAMIVLAFSAAQSLRAQESARRRAALSGHAAIEAVPAAPVPVTAFTHAVRATPATGSARTQAQQRRPFRHAQHEDLECRSCHDTDRVHGRVTITAPRDCDQCHHRDARAETCSRCHAAGGEAGRAYTRVQNMTVAGRAVARNLSFDHGEHAEIACAQCHTTAMTMAVAAEPCAACHTNHHDAARDCAACHEEAPPEAHPLSVHVTCSGAGCHDAGFLTGEPRARQVCLSCHQAQTDHRPGEVCTDCHLLPPWRG